MRYFAYGSNMLTARLRDRVGSVSNPTPYALEAHQLRFHKRSSDGSGKCNLIHTGDLRDVVYGVVFDIKDERLADLDRHEGLGDGYRRSDHRLCLHGSEQAVLMYVAEAGSIDDALLPYKWYLDLVVAGAEEHDLPRDYVSALRATAYRQDPDPSRKTRREALGALEKSMQSAGQVDHTA
jgi:gamma-glutamylcyclotransferase